MKLNKKHIVFGIVFMLFVILVIYRVLNPFVQPRVDELTFTGKKNSNISRVEDATEKRGPKETPTVISKFLNKPIVSGKVYKDLFSIYRPPQKKKIEAMVNKEIKNQKAVDMVKKDPVLEAKEYIASYTLYGTYKSENRKAVFLAKNKLVLVARTGDRLDGKYLIDDIQDNYIRIKALNLNETIHLDMREFNNE